MTDNDQVKNIFTLLDERSDEADLKASTFIHDHATKDMLEHKEAESNETCLYRACDNNRPSVVKALCDKSKLEGANLNVACLYGETVLIYAAREGKTDCVQCLVDAGADLNGADCQGKTALIYAAGNGCTAIVKCLADAGADLNCVE